LGEKKWNVGMDAKSGKAKAKVQNPFRRKGKTGVGVGIKNTEASVTNGKGCAPTSGGGNVERLVWSF